MTDLAERVCLGTRGSALARWQTDHIAGLLLAEHPRLDVEIKVFTTRGDKVLDTPLPLVGGKGLFTAELEEALRSGEIDVAVHSLKDLPTEDPEALTVGAIPQRVNPADVLVSRKGYTLDTLPKGARIGTSSHRRAAQLRHYRPDLQVVDIRGNVDTRIRKAQDADGPYDAIILAHAGLERLGFLDAISQIIPLEILLPAPGQGALGVQCRADEQSLALLEPLNHAETCAAVSAERAFLSGLGGGCSLPISTHAYRFMDKLRLDARVSAVDGARQIDLTCSTAGQAPVEAAYQLGIRLAQEALAQGAGDLLKGL